MTVREQTKDVPVPNEGYTDDPTIPDDADLWRRIHPKQVTIDKNSKRRRPSSAAFKDPKMSVALAHIVIESGDTAETCLPDYKDFGLASITAGLARSSEPAQIVCRDPTPDQQAHALVVGRKTDSVRRRFAVNAQWVIEPPDLEINP